MIMNIEYVSQDEIEAHEAAMQPGIGTVGSLWRTHSRGVVDVAVGLRSMAILGA